jgi:hypothetical protein
MAFGFVLGVFFTLAAVLLGKRGTESRVAAENERLDRLARDLGASRRITELRLEIDEKAFRTSVAKATGPGVDRGRLINDLEHGGYITKKLADELRAEGA